MMHRINIQNIKEKSENAEPVMTHITFVDASDQSDWNFHLHSHSQEAEISLVLSGKGMVFCAGKFYPVKQGDLVIKNADVLHEEKTDPSEPIRQICIGFQNIVHSDFGMNRLISDSIPPVIETKEYFPVLSGLTETMYHLAQENKPGNETVLYDMGNAVISLIRFITPQVNGLGSPEVKYHVIDEVVEYLNTHYDEDITMDMLAERFFFSTSYLAKKFREQVGYSVNQYLLKLRMGEAQRLLVFSENTRIKEIAHRCGYEDIHYFYSSFRKYVGCAPGEFRTLYSVTGLKNE